MKHQYPFFRFTRQQSRGIFFLLLLIALLQGAYYYIKAQPFSGQPQVTVNALVRSRLDSLADHAPNNPTPLFPFNPNYLTDYKGYRLGMSPEQIDRLLVYRKQQKFVNSAAQFQQITQISDSLLAAISPYFKFPSWAQNQKVAQWATRPTTVLPRRIKDLNAATVEDLRTISGIGDVLSQRIVKFRDRLGGFATNEQLYDVYGLPPEVADRALKHFRVQQPPALKKINLNTATVKELAGIVYLGHSVAQQLVAYRNAQGPYTSWEAVRQVPGFPVDRIERIKLYLAL